MVRAVLCCARVPRVAVACRIYYSCADKDTCGCKARKIVDRPKVRHWRGDSVRDLVTLDGEHNHDVRPLEANSTA